MNLFARCFALAAIGLVACSDESDPTRPELGGIAIPLPRLSGTTQLAFGQSTRAGPSESAPTSHQASADGTAPLIYHFSQTASIGFWGTVGVAEATAYLHYFGNAGEITTNVKALRGATLLGSATAPIADERAYPWMRELSHAVQVLFFEPCGVRNEARSDFGARMMSFPPLGPSSVSRHLFDAAYLPDCVPPPEIVGRTKSNGTDEDSGWAICWYQIWYASDGTVVSTQELYCEPL